MTLDRFNLFTITVTPQSVLWKYTVYLVYMQIFILGSVNLYNRVATFVGKAAPLVNHMLSLYRVCLLNSHFGFEDRILVLIVSVPDHCLLFYFNLPSSIHDSTPS